MNTIGCAYRSSITDSCGVGNITCDITSVSDSGVVVTRGVRVDGVIPDGGVACTRGVAIECVRSEYGVIVTGGVGVSGVVT